MTRVSEEKSWFNSGGRPGWRKLRAIFLLLSTLVFVGCCRHDHPPPDMRLAVIHHSYCIFGCTTLVHSVPEHEVRKFSGELGQRGDTITVDWNRGKRP